MKAGLVQFSTLIIGGNDRAVEMYEEVSGLRKGLGYRFVGFVDSNGHSTNLLARHLPFLGLISDIPMIVEEYQTEDVIIAIETSEHGKLKSILDILFDYEDRILVKIIPDM